MCFVTLVLVVSFMYLIHMVHLVPAENLGDTIAVTRTGLQGAESPRPLHIIECYFPISCPQIKFLRSY